MIRICYEDFSDRTHDGAGLHGRAECGARGARIYFLPGLTTAQRRAVLRRLRQEASRGLGPSLPLPQLAVALGLDRVRAAFRITGAIVRLHPAVTLVPGAFVLALIALLVVAPAEGKASSTLTGRTSMAAAAATHSGTQPRTVTAGKRHHGTGQPGHRWATP